MRTIDAAELAARTKDIGRRMIRLDSCPSCGSDTLAAVEIGNDLDSIDGVDPALKNSDYHVCNHCALLFARRRQAAEAAADYYDLFAHLEHRHYAVYPPPTRYRTAKAKVAERHMDYLGQHGLLRSGQVIAHIRCDCGSLQELVHERYEDIVSHGWDYFDSNVRFAREHGLNVNLLDPAGISFPAGVSYDLIIANHHLTHALDPAGDLARIRAALKPDGVLYIYNEADHRLRFEPGRPEFLWVALNNFHKQLLSAQSLTNLLDLAGFDVASLEYDRFYMKAIARLAAKPAGAETRRAGTAPACAAEARRLQQLVADWRRLQTSPVRPVRKFGARLKQAIVSGS